MKDELFTLLTCAVPRERDYSRWKTRAQKPPAWTDSSSTTSAAMWTQVPFTSELCLYTFADRIASLTPWRLKKVLSSCFCNVPGLWMQYKYWITREKPHAVLLFEEHFSFTCLFVMHFLKVFWQKLNERSNMKSKKISNLCWMLYMEIHAFLISYFDGWFFYSGVAFSRLDGF